MSVILHTVPKKENKRKTELRFVGAFVPTNLAQYFTLYCLAFEVSKNSILKDMCTAWQEEQRDTFPQDVLEENIALRCLPVYEQQETVKDANNLLRQLRAELVKKEIEQPSIDRIIKLIKDGAKKNT